MLIHWSRFLPRLALLLLFLLAVWWWQNAILAWQIRSIIARQTGAGAALALVQTDWENNTVVLTDLQLFDRKRPERRLLKTQRISARTSADDLLKRYFHFPEITVEGIQVEIDGTESSKTLPDLLGNIAKQGVPNGHGSATADWADELDWTVFLTESPEDAAKNVLAQLETSRFVAELQQRWPEEVRQFEAAAAQIRKRLQNVKTVSAHASQTGDKLQLVQAILTELEGADLDIQLLMSSVAQLKLKAQKDSQSLEGVLRRDQATIKSLKPPVLDADAISEAIVGAEIREQWEKTVTWGQWATAMLIPSDEDAAVQNAAENTVPTKSKPAFFRKRFRGETIPLTAFDVRPALLIDRANLTGQILFGDSPLFFHAAVSDIAHPVSIGPGPVVAQISLSGVGVPASPVMPEAINAGAERLNAAIEPNVFPNLYVTLNIDHIGDGTTRPWEDMMIVRCPVYQLPQRILGNPERFAVSVSPGQSQLDGVVILKGEQLSGEVRLAQSNICLSVELPPKLQQSALQKSLDSVFSTLDRFDASLIVSGTREKPVYTVKSNLGEHLKPKLENVVLTEWAKLRQSLDKSVTDDTQLAFTVLDTIIREQLDPVVQDVNATRSNWERQLASISDVPIDQLVGEQLSKLSDKDRKRLQNFVQAPAVQALLQQHRPSGQGNPPPQLEDAIQRGIDKLEDKIPGLLDKLRNR